jgi:hypothetical protein
VAIFKVLSEDHSDRPDDAIISNFVLRVEVLEGQVTPGLTFTAYCTHHSFLVTVLQVSEQDSVAVLACETTWPMYDGFFENAVINSAGVGRREQFSYAHGL